MPQFILDIGATRPEKKEILVVSQDEALITLLQKSLREECDILAAHNSKDGEFKATHHHPKLIMVDSSLPDLDGHKTLIALNSNTITRKIPILIIKEDTMKPSEWDLFKSVGNVNQYVSRHFDEKVIRNLILSTIKK